MRAAHALRACMAHLGGQLAVAAGLTRAWQLGWAPGFVTVGKTQWSWKPGCRMEAPHG